MGRPPIYTPELAAEVLERLTKRSLVSVCEDEGMPSSTTVMKWLSDPSLTFAADYARACEARAHYIAEETFDIADDGNNDWMERRGADGVSLGWQVNGEAVARSRLRLDQRKWAAGQMNPKVYGVQRFAVEHSGTITLVNAPTEDLLSELHQLMATGHIPKAEVELVDEDDTPGLDLV